MQAQIFENTINNGLSCYDGTIKFEEYSNIYLKNAQISPKTREGYEVLIERINSTIGHIKFQNLQAHHLESFYRNLAEDDAMCIGRFATSKSLGKVIEKEKISRGMISRKAGIALATASVACSGKQVALQTANKIANALEMPVEQLFEITEKYAPFSDATISHHHKVISLILNKAKKERIIQFNVASEHATAPKAKKKEAEYLDDKQAKRFVEILLQEEDIRKKTSILLCLYSGIRRGEYGGLKWENVDFENNLIHIVCATQRQKQKGIVEVDTKNYSSKRVIRLPKLIFDVLAEYREFWLDQKIKCGDKWEGDDWVFIQYNGKPISHNTLNTWLNKIIEKNELKHFTPHSLRHTFCTCK